VLRSTWYGGWIEILDHSPGAIVLERATDYLPLFVNHDPRDQVGVHENVRLEGKQLRAAMRFSRSQRGQDMLRDVQDGIRPKVSVGYFVHEMVLEKQDNETGIDTYRVTKWEPVENSLAGIPADPSVGVGRTVTSETRPVVIRSLASRTHPGAEPTQEQTMKTEIPAPAGAAPETRVHVEAGQTAERTRVSEIDAICETHAIDGAVRRALISEGASLQVAQRKVLEIVQERAKNPPRQAPLVELNEKEQKRYSFARAILGQGDSKIDDGFEREIAKEIQGKLPNEYKFRGGVLIPTFTTRAGLDASTATKGAELKFTQPGEFIDMLRNKMRVRELGARVLSGLTGPVSFPKQTGAASGSWIGENGGVDVAESNLLLTLVTLGLKTYQASTSFSRQLLVSALSASVDAENMVREDLATVHALAWDLAAIAGSGAANQPRGILNTVGIGSVAIGANGGAPTYQSILDLETVVTDANVDDASLAYLTNAVMRGKLKNTPQLASANGVIPIWQDGEVNGYKAAVSKQVPRALTKGTSVDCHAMIFGAWNNLILGEYGVLELITDPFRLKKQGMIEVTSFQMGDVACRYPEAFAADLDYRNI
jgi:HK97 family phage major capsid protein